jgi:hypothetical protein
MLECLARKPFQPSLMFVSKGYSLPKSSTFQVLHSRCPTHKRQTWLEMPAREKHSSLLQTIVTWTHCDNTYKDFTYNDFTYNINKCDIKYI